MSELLANAPTLLAIGGAVAIFGLGAFAGLLPKEKPHHHVRPLRVFVCSPLRGDYVGNSMRARLYCRIVAERGHVPYAPHLLFTQFLDDTREKDRELGISLGLEELRRCDEVWVFLPPGGHPSEGMRREIALALELGIRVRYFEADAVGAALREVAA